MYSVYIVHIVHILCIRLFSIEQKIMLKLTHLMLMDLKRNQPSFQHVQFLLLLIRTIINFMYLAAGAASKNYSPSHLEYILCMYIYAKLLFYLAIIVCSHNQKRDKNTPKASQMWEKYFWYENNDNYIYKYKYVYMRVNNSASTLLWCT